MKLKNGQKKKQTSAAPYQVQRSEYILIPHQSNPTVPLQLRKIYQWLNGFPHLKYGLAVHGICMLVVKPRKNIQETFFFHAAEVSLRPLMCFTFYIACVRSVLSYACPIFHFSMPVYLSSNLIGVLLFSLNYFGADIISIYVIFFFYC